MPSGLRIAFRNTGRQKKRTVLLAGAIAFGVLVVTLLNGFTGGVSRNITRTVTDLIGGHVYVNGTELTDSRLIVNVIRDTDGGSLLQAAVDQVAEQIDMTNRRSRTLATLIFGSKQTNLLLDGVDWDGEPSFFPSLSLVDGALPGPADRSALILPVSAAERLRGGGGRPDSGAAEHGHRPAERRRVRAGRHRRGLRDRRVFVRLRPSGLPGRADRYGCGRIPDAAPLLA